MHLDSIQPIIHNLTQQKPEYHFDWRCQKGESEAFLLLNNHKIIFISLDGPLDQFLEFSVHRWLFRLSKILVIYFFRNGHECLLNSSKRLPLNTCRVVGKGTVVLSPTSLVQSLEVAVDE